MINLMFQGCIFLLCFWLIRLFSIITYDIPQVVSCYLHLNLAKGSFRINMIRFVFSFGSGRFQFESISGRLIVCPISFS